MLKRSGKYHIIAFLNLSVLTILLALWTDKLELILNDGIRPIEFLKIIGFTITSLVGMRILVIYFRKRNVVDAKQKIKIASVLTLLISSYLYIQYFSKAVNHIIVNRQLREQTADKVKSADGNGTKANSLTVKEYQEISKLHHFPKLPKEATNISYSFEYDGFLPDYYLAVTYDLPKEIKVDTLYFQQGDFTKSLTVDVAGDKQKVSYAESEQ